MDEKKNLVIVCGAYQQPEHKAHYAAIAEQGDLGLVLLHPLQDTLESIDAVCRNSRAVIVDGVSFGTPQQGDNHSLYWRLAHDPQLVAEYNQLRAKYSEPFVVEVNPSEIPLNLLRKYVEIYLAGAAYLPIPELSIPHRIRAIKQTQGKATPITFYDFGSLDSRLNIWQVLLWEGYNWLLTKSETSASSSELYPPDVFMDVLKAIENTLNNREGNYAAANR